MTELQIIGVGTWSPKFGSWTELVADPSSGGRPEAVNLQPDRIPPRERRRAPQLVKMAIEVMDQACGMANVDPEDVAVVYSSVMGDMQITDYMCAALTREPKMISPTKFHNSVHNAAPGYWSIATGAFSPATAVSAFHHTPSMALLEACIQAAEENTPVLCVTQEVAAPIALMDTCPSELPFSAALLLSPVGFSDSPMVNITFEVAEGAADWPAAGDLDAEFASNMSARLLPMLVSMATDRAVEFRFPIGGEQSLSVHLSPCTT